MFYIINYTFRNYFHDLSYMYYIRQIQGGKSGKTLILMGEITLKVTKLELISKCLHPLPEKFHGLQDVETIYRQRYLDLIANQEKFSVL